VRAGPVASPGQPPSALASAGRAAGGVRPEAVARGGDARCWAGGVARAGARPQRRPRPCRASCASRRHPAGALQRPPNGLGARTRCAPSQRRAASCAGGRVGATRPRPAGANPRVHLRETGVPLSRGAALAGSVGGRRPPGVRGWTARPRSRVRGPSPPPRPGAMRQRPPSPLGGTSVSCLSRPWAGGTARALWCRSSASAQWLVRRMPWASVRGCGTSLSLIEEQL